MRSSCREAGLSFVSAYSAQFFRTRMRPASADSTTNPPRVVSFGPAGSATHSPISGLNSFQSAGGAAGWARTGSEQSSMTIEIVNFMRPPGSTETCGPSPHYHCLWSRI